MHEAQHLFSHCGDTRKGEYMQCTRNISFAPLALPALAGSVPLSSLDLCLYLFPSPSFSVLVVTVAVSSRCFVRMCPLDSIMLCARVGPTPNSSVSVLDSHTLSEPSKFVSNRGAWARETSRWRSSGTRETVTTSQIKKISNTVLAHTVVEADSNLQEESGLLDGTKSSVYVHKAYCACIRR